MRRPLPPDRFRQQGMDPGEFAGPPRQKKAKRGPPQIPPAAWERALDEAAGFLDSGSWQEAQPIHMIALYALCHQKVYGVEATEFTEGRTLWFAVQAVKKCLEGEFGGERGDLCYDVQRAVDFVRWAWMREEDRNAWRRANGREIVRIGWRLFFSKAFTTDYRLHLAQKQKAPHR